MKHARVLSLIIASILVSYAPYAGADVSATPVAEFVRGKTSGRIIFAKGDEVTTAGSAREQAENFISQSASTLGSGVTSFKTSHEERDSLGMSHIKYQQYYRTFPVLGAELSVHTTSAYALSSAGIAITPNLRTKSVASLSLAKALKVAIGAWQKQFESKARPKVMGTPARYILDLGLIKNAAVSSPRLVWEVDLTGGSGVTDYKYYIDAQDGTVRLALAQSQGQAMPIDRKIYDCSQPPPTGDSYRCPKVVINGYTYGRLENDPVVGPNPSCMPATDTDDLYAKLAVIHQFWWDNFQRNGGSGKGGTGDGYYYPTRTYAYAYSDFSPGWTCPGASQYRGTISFCGGLVAKDDTVSHEYAHTVVESSHFDAQSGLAVGMLYQGESGALNESHSDVMGQMYEIYLTGTTDWVNTPGYSFTRVLYDPPSAISESAGTPLPDRFNSPYVYCGSGDHSGVHWNSTIPSKAAYLMSRGGYFNGCTITPIGESKMQQILYRAVTLYYPQTGTFNHAYNDQMQSCQDLIGQFGITADDCVQVGRALQAVEMDQPGACSGLPASVPGCVDLIGW